MSETTVLPDKTTVLPDKTTALPDEITTSPDEITMLSADITECFPVETESYKACRFIGKLKFDDKLEFDLCVDNTGTQQHFYLNDEQKNSPFLTLFLWVVDHLMNKETEKTAIEILNNYLINSLGSSGFNKAFFVDLCLFLDQICNHCFIMSEEFKIFDLEYGEKFKGLAIREHRYHVAEKE